MIQNILIIFLSVITLISCRNSETKDDPSKFVIESKTDTTTIAVPVNTVDSKNVIKQKDNKNVIIEADSLASVVAPKVNTDPGSGHPQGIPATPKVAVKNDILANIDRYLVSAAQSTVAPSGGITNCTVTVTNTLPDATFQKALVEVSIRKETGEEVRTDYYTVVNIEPAGKKVVKVPNTTQGTKVVTHIVKVKSNELTKGEWVLAGTHFVAN